MDIAADVKRRLKVAGLTQGQLARVLGIDQTAFSRMLRGQRRAPDGLEYRINAALTQLEFAVGQQKRDRERLLEAIAAISDK